MTAPLGVALVGAGVIGKIHADAIAATPGLQLRHVVDLDLDVAQRLATSSLPTSDGTEVSYGTELDQALARDDIAVVSVATPSGVHAQDSLRILAANKHLIVEKPVDVEPARARELAAAAAKAAERGVRATVISQRRFDPASQLVARLVAEGKFGKLTSGIASVPWWRSQGYYDSAGWRGTWALDGGGALANQGIHTLDLLLWMFGQPSSVTAQIGLLAHERMEVEDTLVAIVAFEKGALAVLHATTAASPGLVARFQVMGTTGSAVIEHNQLSYLHVLGDGEDIGPMGLNGAGNQAEAAGLPEEGETEATRASAPHARQFADFVDAIHNNRQPAVTIADGALALEVVRGSYVSAVLGRTVAVTELTSGALDHVVPKLPESGGRP